MRRVFMIALAGAMLISVARAAPAPLAASVGDAQRGAAVYGQCAACHSLGVDRTGPRHCGLVGRRAGSVAGFPYSDAMRRSRIVWTADTLDRFLANPLKMIPGTAMGYAGVTDRKDRRDLVAYLISANDSAECNSPAGRP